MERLEIIDPYLIERVAITENTDNAHLLEVDGTCPLCGNYLLIPKGKRMNKKYQIAHIYPNSPTLNEVKELQGLERLGTNCEDFENKIALCKDCHGYYDDHKTKEEYLRLVMIKKRLLAASKAKISTSYQDIDEEIVLVINSLTNIDAITLKKMELEYKALKISSKIEQTYSILKYKIETYVCIYFNLIKETFQNLDQEKKLNFDLVASEVSSSSEACEAVISYFVQSCEVFHEIP